jgi:Metallo-peptidase family M12B Reprolysin-like
LFEPLESRHLLSTTLALSKSVPLSASPDTSGQDSPPGYVIDLLAVYTPQTLTAEGSVNAVYTELNQEISYANTAFANSNIPLTLRLLAFSATSYNESGSLSRDLTRLATPGDGYMDDTLQLRDLLGADLVVLIDSQGSATKTGTVEGISTQLLNPKSSTRSRNAFIVIDQAAPLDHYVLAHEVGHTLGATHAVGDPQANGAAPYAHGYRFYGTDNIQYHDIMAYDPGVRIPYFSDPDIIYAGVPIGNAKTADAARIIREDAPIVSAYRVAKPIGALDSVSLSQITGYDYDPVTQSAVMLRVDIDGQTRDTFLGDDGQTDSSAPFGIPAHQFAYTLPRLSQGKHQVQIYAIDPSDGTPYLIATTTIQAPTPIFDEAYYLANNPNVATLIAQHKFKSAWDEFNRVGQFQGLDPSPYFNTQYYLANNPAVAKALQHHSIRSAFQQFLSKGEKQGLNASALFDESYYLDTYPAIAAEVSKGLYPSGLEQYLLVGMREQLSAVPPA